MKRRIFGTIFLVLGIVLVIVSGLLVGYNLYVEEMSGFHAQVAMDKLMAQMPEDSVAVPDTAPSTPGSNAPVQEYVPDDYPMVSEGNAAELMSLHGMPEVVIDGVAYVGYLDIPAIDLQLPVIGDSSPENLEIAPCRFYGTVYQKNFVIGGHRYRRHFRKLSTLGYGEKVNFTDMDGNLYQYKVADCEVIEPYEAEYLCSGNWDLSLYTCTPGGLTRVVLRCLRAD